MTQETTLITTLLRESRANAKALTDLLSRAARTESKLSQLMLYSGMQTDGRHAILPRGASHVG